MSGIFDIAGCVEQLRDELAHHGIKLEGIVLMHKDTINLKLLAMADMPVVIRMIGQPPQPTTIAGVTVWSLFQEPTK